LEVWFFGIMTLFEIITFFFIHPFRFPGGLLRLRIVTKLPFKRILAEYDVDIIVGHGSAFWLEVFAGAGALAMLGFVLMVFYSILTRGFS